MKYFRLLFPVLLILFSCRNSAEINDILEDMQESLDFGNISEVIQIADSLKKSGHESKEILHIADSLAQIAERVGLDFSVSEDQVNASIKRLTRDFTDTDKSVWEEKGWLEWRMIDGEKKYFNRAASNLVLIKKFRENKAERLLEISREPGMIFRLDHTTQVLKSSQNKSEPVIPVKMKITYTVRVHPDAVPEGEMIRCWMPWPKEDPPRQKEIKLINSSNPEYSIAPDTAIHSTIFMKETAKKGIPTVFQVVFTYVSSAQHYNMHDTKILPYDKLSKIYQKYTSEQLPHICFSDEIMHLADSITADETDPASIVKKIYFWFKENILWTGALEYSTIPNIPEYVLNNGRGDCGMQTFLFISMLRYKGIPIRWKSGWMMPPDNENLHDWSEVYYEGAGWVPVDVSYDLQKSGNSLIKDFYLSGIDAYRMTVNDGIAGPLHPGKKFLRSEPYDFQRGEVEWNGGNLYFDKWDYDMKIEYIK
jgi:hypothetical protein